MKKIQRRALKEFAKRLPESYTIQKKTIGNYGYEMARQDLKPPEGEDSFDPDKVYLRKGDFFVKINHLNKLKRAYNNKKESGIQEYISWLNSNNKHVNKVFRDLKMNETEDIDKGILDLIKSPANKFWKNLIAFLYSFMAIFKNQENEKAV